MRSLFVLVLALCPALATASPGIRRLEPAAIEKRTDLTARLTIVKREVTQLEVKPAIQVTTIEARVESTTGRKASALPVGTLLRFKSQCSLDTTPIDPQMAGYPNGRCGMGWTALPAAFADPKAKTVAVRLIMGTDGTVSLVPTTWPVTASLGGKIVAQPAP